MFVALTMSSFSSLILGVGAEDRTMHSGVEVEFTEAGETGGLWFLVKCSSDISCGKGVGFGAGVMVQRVKPPPASHMSTCSSPSGSFSHPAPH